MRVNWNLVWTRFGAIVPLIAILALGSCEERRAPLETATATVVMQRILDTPSPAPSATPAPSPTSPLAISPAAPTALPSPSATSTRTPVPPTATRAAPSITPAPLPQPTLSPSYVRRLITVPGNPARLYAVTSDFRFVRSNDGGITWEPNRATTNGADLVSGAGIDYRNPRTLYLTTDKGIFRTDNEGQSWVKISDQVMQDISVSFDDPQVLWSVTARGSQFFVNEHIMRSLDGGLSWRVESDGLDPWQLSSPILIDPQDSNTLFFAATIGTKAPRPSVYRGTRDGNWKAIDVFPRYCCFFGYGLAWSAPSRTLYTGTTHGKLYASTNAKALDVSTVEWREVSDFGASRATVIALAHGEPGETLYVSIGDTYSAQKVLMKSGDGGKTWQTLTLP